MRKKIRLKDVLKNRAFSVKLEKNIFATVRFFLCIQCGTRYAARFQFEDNSAVGTPYGHIESSGINYVKGGRSAKGRHLLCDFCLGISGVVDAVKEAESQRIKAESRLNNIRKEAERLAGDLQQIVKEKKIK